MPHRVLSLLCIMTCLVLISCCNSREVEKDDKQKPNIVYILCDDLGYGDIQALNPERGKIKTPCVDKLAREGMVFTNAHSGSSVCTPTRYGILTGRYAWRTRLQKGVVSGHDDCLIEANRLTVGGFLQQQGYHTAIVGKWHLNYHYLDSKTKNKIPKKPRMKNKKGSKRKSLEQSYFVPRTVKGKRSVRPLAGDWKSIGTRTAGVPMGTIISDGPISHGFDYFFGFHHAGSMDTIVENDKVIKEIHSIETLRLLTKKSCDYIQQRAEKARQGSPFFLYVPLNSPHGPVVPSKGWQGKSGLNAYGDYVMETDWSVGEIMKTLKDEKLEKNTLVIFSSDNGISGYTANMTDLRRKGHYPTHIYRGSKADIWDGGHRVPFVVKWPQHGIKAGSKSDQLICLTDLLATCSDILEESLPDNSGEDSVSFLPALHGRNIPQKRKAVIHHSMNGKFAIRQGDWKLCFCHGSGGWTAPKDKQAKKEGLPSIQLYDMKDGANEEKNLHEKHPDIVTALTELLTKIVTEGRSTPGTPQKNDVPVDYLKQKS